MLGPAAMQAICTQRLVVVHDPVQYRPTSKCISLFTNIFLYELIQYRFRKGIRGIWNSTKIRSGIREQLKEYGI